MVKIQNQIISTTDNKCAKCPIVTIYALKDPRTLAVRYIGKTSKSPSRRYRDHLRGKNGPYCKKWIFSLLRDNLEPIFEIIEQCGENWQEREKYWLQYYKASGHFLTNLTIGGDGCLGYKQSAETKLKKSKKLRGIKRTKIWRDKISLAMRGRPHKWTEEGRRKLGISLRRYHQKHQLRLTEKWKQNISLGLKRAWADGKRKGHPMPEHTKQRLIERNRGRKYSIMQKQQISERVTLWHKTRKLAGKCKSQLSLPLLD